MCAQVGRVYAQVGWVCAQVGLVCAQVGWVCILPSEMGEGTVRGASETKAESAAVSASEPECSCWRAEESAQVPG